MSTDWYTKLVLTVVAVCLVLLAVQGFQPGGMAGGGPGAEGRYRLTVVPMARIVLRFDAETGRTWKALFPDLNMWAPVADSPDELLGAAAAEAPAPPAPAPTPPEPLPTEQPEGEVITTP